MTKKVGGYDPANNLGGFGCRRCVFFTNPGCEVVDVEATTSGCCNLWKGKK